MYVNRALCHAQASGHDMQIIKVVHFFITNRSSQFFISLDLNIYQKSILLKFTDQYVFNQFHLAKS